MEPISYYFESVDRVGITITKKEPFKAWLKLVYPDTTEEDFTHNNIYLVGEDRLSKGMEEWLSNEYEDIFENDLNEWVTDEKSWPVNRSYTLFNEWFNVQIFDMVYDLEQ